jgi:hypothetical protein
VDLVEPAEDPVERAEGSPSTFWVADALTMWWLTQRLIAVMKENFIGRSTSQNRMMRLTSVAFSAL